AHHDGGAGLPACTGRIHSHLRRRPSVSQSSRSGPAPVDAGAAAAAGDAHQSGGDGYFRLPLRGLRPSRLPRPPTPQGGGRSVMTKDGRPRGTAPALPLPPERGEGRGEGDGSQSHASVTPSRPLTPPPSSQERGRGGVQAESPHTYFEAPRTR